jgi:hypothetical protein
MPRARAQEAIFRQPHEAEHPLAAKGAPPQTAPAAAAAAPLPEATPGARPQQQQQQPPLPAVAPPLPPAANNLSIDHLLMLANLTGGAGLDWPGTVPMQQGARPLGCCFKCGAVVVVEQGFCGAQGLRVSEQLVMQPRARQKRPHAWSARSMTVV